MNKKASGMKVKSPISGLDACILAQIATGELASNYKKLFRIDISVSLHNVEDVFLCKCCESGFRFYYPFSIVGASEFYEKLQVNDWY